MRIGMHSGVSSLAGSTNSIIGHDMYGDDDSMQAGSFEPMFRNRASSNSVAGTSTRVTPSMEHPSTFDDFDFPPWVENTVPAIPSDIVDRTDQVQFHF